MDTSDLAEELLGLINRVVTIRFVGVARPDGQFAGQRLYGIIEAEGFLVRVIRPERDFDFLD